MEQSGPDPTPDKSSPAVHHRDARSREQAAAARGRGAAQGCDGVQSVCGFFIGINNSYTVTSPNTARETTGTNGDLFLQVTELRTQSDS